MRIRQIVKMINKEFILYLIFGVLTTIVNFGSFAIFQTILGKEFYLISNVISFVCATTFAFITNKQYVFEKKCWYWEIVIKEAIEFVSARIGTFLVIEELGLLIAVKTIEEIQIEDWPIDGILFSKIILAFLAVLANYILSKFWIFRTKSK